MFMISMIDTNHEKLFIAWGIKHDFKLSDDLTHVLIALFTLIFMIRLMILHIQSNSMEDNHLQKYYKLQI